VGGDCTTALGALLDHCGAVAGRERSDRAQRERFGFAADDARVAAQQRLGGEQQLEALIERALEGIDLARARPVTERRQDRRQRRSGRGRGQRARERDGASQRQLEARLRDLSRRGKGEAPTGNGDTNADALVGGAVDSLDLSAADAQLLGGARDPARLDVLAAPRGGRDEVAQKLEWRQPVAPVAPVAPAATVAPVGAVAPLAGASASRSMTKISVALAGIVPWPLAP
jgi:hypothetical protein